MKKALISAALVLAAGSASAADFRYTYLEVGYGEAQIQDTDGDSLFLGGAVDLQQGVGLIGSYYSMSMDNHVDGDVFTVGGQFHTKLNNQADMVASVQLIDADFDYRHNGVHYGDSDTGLLVSAGLRFAVQQNLQLEGDISYNTNDFWDGNEFGLKAGARFFVDRQLSIAAGVASDQEVDGLYISGRYDLK